MSDRSAFFWLLGFSFLGLLILFQTCIYHDALWTFGYLRSIFIDHDLDFYNEFILRNAYFMYVPTPSEPIFYAGTSFCLAPFFWLGHLIALGFAFNPTFFSDGYSLPYTVMTGLGGALFGISSLVLQFRLFRRSYDVFPSFMATFLILGAGHFLFYVFVWPLYSHAFSVFMVSFFILLWVQTRKNRALSQWALLGGILGWAAWIRPQNALFVCLPLWDFFKNKEQSFNKKAWGLLVFLLLGGWGLFPQAVLWYKSSGAFWVDAYQHIGDDFFWLKPRFGQLFFSWNKGLFTWTPVFWLCLPGFYFLKKKNPQIAWPLLLAFFLQSYLVASYEFPDGGAGFGSRYLLNTLPFLGLCLSACIDRFQRNKKLWILLVGMLTLWNLLSIWVYHQEGIPHNNYTPQAREWIGLVSKQGIQSAKTFLFSTHINENFFFRQLYSAGTQGNPLKFFSIFLFWGLCCLGLMRVSQRLWVWPFWDVHYSRRLSLLFFLIFGCLNVFLFSLESAPAYGKIYSVLRLPYERQLAPPSVNAREILLSANHPKQTISLRYPIQAKTVDLTFTLIQGESLKQGTHLALVTFKDQQDRTHSLLVVKGLHVDDYTRFHSLASLGEPVRTRVKNKVVHHWMDQDEEGHYFFGAGYHHRYSLSALGKLKEITLEYQSSIGSLIVTGIHLAENKVSSL